MSFLTGLLGTAMGTGAAGATTGAGATGAGATGAGWGSMLGSMMKGSQQGQQGGSWAQYLPADLRAKIPGAMGGGGGQKGPSLASIYDAFQKYQNQPRVYEGGQLTRDPYMQSSLWSPEAYGESLGLGAYQPSTSSGYNPWQGTGTLWSGML